MPSVTVRNIPDETHRALKVSAARHGRSTEAEIRSILESAMQPKIAMGNTLAAIGRSVGGVDLPFVRDATPVAPASFE